jgi:hypothetical protein
LAIPEEKHFIHGLFRLKVCRDSILKDLIAALESDRVPDLDA